MNKIGFWREENGTMYKIADVPAEISEALAWAIRDSAWPPSGREKEVCVVAVDEEELAKHMQPQGKANPVSVGQVFPSTAAASFHIGLDVNLLALALAAEHRKLKPDAKKCSRKSPAPRPLPSAMLRGVRFVLRKDIEGTSVTPPAVVEAHGPGK